MTHPAPEATTANEYVMERWEKWKSKMFFSFSKLFIYLLEGTGSKGREGRNGRNEKCVGLEFMM